MGTNSAQPEALESFAAGSREADGESTAMRGRLDAALAEFAERCRFGTIDASSMMAAFGSWITANGVDADWTTQIAAAFRAAGGDGTLPLPDAAIEASLRSAGLDGQRQALTFADPVAFGAPPTSGFVADPVNTALGNLVERETDLLAPGLAAGLSWVRVHNSRDTSVGPFGSRWSSWASARLIIAPDGAHYTGPDGQRAVFPRAGAGFGRVAGIAGLVEQDRDGSVLAWFGGTRWRFDAAGRPVHLSSGPGTDVVLSYDETGHLAQLAHVGGRSVAVVWAGARIVGLVGSDGTRVDYRYEDGELVEAVGIAGARHYRLDEGGLLASVTDADGVVEMTTTYDRHARVVTQVSPFGRTTRFGYLPGNVTVTTDDTGGASNTFLHDSSGRLLAAVDSHERAVRMSYDDWGNPVAVTDRCGAVTIQEWDARGRLTARLGPDGDCWRFTHDEHDRVTSVTAPDGAAVRYRYCGAERIPSQVVDGEGGVSRVAVAGGVISRIVDPDGVVIRFRHDRDGLLVTVIDADGGVARIERDSAGHPVAAVSPGGARTRFVVDARGLPTERHDPDGAVWRFEYSAVGRPTARIDPTGARTELRYGDHGELAEVVDPAGASTARRYDACGNLAAVIDAGGATWSFLHDSLSRLAAVTDPTGATWRHTHDGEGRLVSTVDPVGVTRAATVDCTGRVVGVDDGLVTGAFEADALGRTTAHVRPGGTTERATFDRNGRATAVTDANGGRTRFRWTPGGRLARVTSPAGRIDRYTYDRCGRPTVHTDGNGQRWTRTFDVDGRQIARTTPTGETETFTYDRCGRLTRHHHPATGDTVYDRDLTGRIVTITDPARGRREFGYDPCGRLVRAVDALGHTTTYAYDVRGRLLRVRDPLGGLTTYRYDETGRVIAETDPLDRTTTYTYDPSGNLVGRTDPTGTHRRWTYDPSGRLARIDAGEVGIGITRDALGRPVRVTETDRPDIVLGWDACGQLTHRRRGDVAMGWTYDADGLPSTVVLPDGSRTRCTRDRAGRTTATAHPLLGSVHLTRDPAGRLTGRRADGVEETWTYTDGALTSHVRNGDRTGITSDEGGRITAANGTSYGYDAAGQLVAAGAATYRFDAGGRLVHDGEHPYTYDAAGQLATAGDTAFDYDAAGRRTRQTGPDGERRYTWDALDRLRTVTGPDRTTELQIDALGELAAVDGRAVAWDSPDPLSPLRWLDDTPVPGVACPTTPGADPWDTGRRGELTVDGLVWLRNRAYDPATRAFLSTDPLPAVPATPYAATPYHYAGNDPVNHADPLGLRPLSDADLQAFRDQAGHGAWGDVTDWVGENASMIGHTALDVVGLIPVVGEPADLINAAWYTAEGDYLSAGLSAAAAIPVAGWFATGGKLGIRGARLVDSAAGARMFVTGRPPMVPRGATRGTFTTNASSNFGHGQVWRWTDTQVGGKRLHAHGPDPTAPAGSNAASGSIYRIQQTQSPHKGYLDASGNLYRKNNFNENSPHFVPSAANDTHIPWPTSLPSPDRPWTRFAVPNVAGIADTGDDQ